jgi:hypothetical protein
MLSFWLKKDCGGYDYDCTFFVVKFGIMQNFELSLDGVLGKIFSKDQMS